MIDFSWTFEDIAHEARRLGCGETEARRSLDQQEMARLQEIADDEQWEPD